VVIAELISATKTDTGPTVTCVLDERNHETGKKVSKEDLDNINIRNNEFHGDRNCKILPIAT
jgi:hypothetical protein